MEPEVREPPGATKLRILDQCKIEEPINIQHHWLHPPPLQMKAMQTGNKKNGEKQISYSHAEHRLVRGYSEAINESNAYENYNILYFEETKFIPIDTTEYSIEDQIIGSEDFFQLSVELPPGHIEKLRLFKLQSETLVEYPEIRIEGELKTSNSAYERNKLNEVGL